MSRVENNGDNQGKNSGSKCLSMVASGSGTRGKEVWGRPLLYKSFHTVLLLILYVINLMGDRLVRTDTDMIDLIMNSLRGCEFCSLSLSLFLFFLKWNVLQHIVYWRWSSSVAVVLKVQSPGQECQHHLGICRNAHSLKKRKKVIYFYGDIG